MVRRKQYSLKKSAVYFSVLHTETVQSTVGIVKQGNVELNKVRQCHNVHAQVVIINLAFTAAMPVWFFIRAQLRTMYLEAWIALACIKG